MRRSRLLGGYNLRNGLFVPSLIKSIQRGTIVIAGGTSSNTATLSTAVVLANSLLTWGSQGLNTSGQVDAQMFTARITLTNTTTVTATRGGTTEALTVPYEVIEFWPGVLKSVQRGTVVTGTPATITAVNTAKSMLSYLGCVGATSTGGEWGSWQGYLVLTNSTTVTATEGGGNTTHITAGYQVAEFY